MPPTRASCLREEPEHTMFAYTAKRLLQGIITVWFIATATFIAMHAVPGDPLLKDKAVSEEVRRRR